MGLKKITRYFVLILVTLLGCSTLPKTSGSGSNWTEKYIGKVGYFSRPIFVSNDSPNQEENFNRCKAAKIVSFSTSAFTEIHVEQSNKKFTIIGINRKSFFSDIKTWFDKDKNTFTYLDKYFSDKLKIRDRKIPGGKFLKEYLCARQYAIGMTPDEFMFVAGEPNHINRSNYSGNTKNQWVYNISPSEPWKANYYYFDNNKLTSWQLFE